MSIEDNGGAAFPKAGLDPWHKAVEVNPGMTLRDYFAAKAMQGMLADIPKTLYGMNWQENVANASYEIADAMLEARKK